EAKTELDRVKDAYAKGTESETNLVKAQALFDVRTAEHTASKATRDAAKENVKAAFQALHSTEVLLGYCKINAKIAGRISYSFVKPGTLVQADTMVLTTIVRVDELYVWFDAPEGDLFAFQQAMIAHGDGNKPIRVEVGVAKEEGYPHEGWIDFRDNR